jgi:hypothetical protein
VMDSLNNNRGIRRQSNVMESLNNNTWSSIRHRQGKYSCGSRKRSDYRFLYSG